jgi:hypothetical protein
MTENHGVPGSNPGPATSKSPANAGFVNRVLIKCAAVYHTVTTPGVLKQLVEALQGLFLHTRNDVAVDVQGYLDGGVAEHPGDGVQVGPVP